MTSFYKSFVFICVWNINTMADIDEQFQIWILHYLIKFCLSKMKGVIRVMNENTGYYRYLIGFLYEKY